MNGLKTWIKNRLTLKKRNLRVSVLYLLYLMVSTRKHTLRGAAQLSGVDKSLFSRFLKKNKLAIFTLNDLSRKEAKRYSRIMKNLNSGLLPWKIAILIDSTLQRRATRHTENSKRFNHGQGFVIGHQWTNVLLIISNVIIPLPPIPFHSKGYCRRNGLVYKTEHELVVEMIAGLKLKEYVGIHDPKDVVVLADSGYDCKSIENVVEKKKWNFIIALGKTRSVKTVAEYHRNRKSAGWTQVAEFFKNHRRVKWQTVRFMTNGRKKRRKDFRIRAIIAYLRDVGKVQLICSEMKKRSDGRRKYLACNDLKATARQILLGYRLRWSIEIFHKEVKQYLGFEDVAAKSFASISSHVHWVYCAYLLLNMGPPGVPKEGLSIKEKQERVSATVNSKDLRKYRQILTQINGTQKLMGELNQALEAA
ncbi:MAG: transposase [bacterium]